MSDTLVSVSELAKKLENSTWRVMDCRFSLADAQAGQAAYDESHIPGACYVNLDKQLSVPHIPGQTGRHPLPDKADWINTVQGLGISPQAQVVVYDDAGGAIAARMWWMLRWIGHESVAVLNGGWQKWRESDLPVDKLVPEPVIIPEDEYSGRTSLVRIVMADEVAHRLASQEQLLLDARELPRFRGDTEPLDPVAGHIPGALCSAFSANLDAQGYFLSREALRNKFRPAIDSGKPVVCYCGSGVTAAHNILAMKIAGVEEPALYPGSWSEWITDPTRPVATGN